MQTKAPQLDPKVRATSVILGTQIQTKRTGRQGGKVDRKYTGNIPLGSETVTPGSARSTHLKMVSLPVLGVVLDDGEFAVLKVVLEDGEFAVLGVVLEDDEFAVLGVVLEDGEFAVLEVVSCSDKLSLIGSHSRSAFVLILLPIRDTPLE
ncbi:hypothetical protein CHS0354_015477 [Potamilus streckersoni]|uniref:Uncharacterized protein n=1 Tax=Potamilus streckersoni TaxID=2493646 RepID=A0AAE0VUD5_9BIVA|nr:hypothetical protein CHS0354_015477 [Potamilus streckersoni]